MNKFKENFQSNQEELQKIRNKINRNFITDKNKKKHPINQIKKLILLSKSDGSTAQISDCIRKIHDFYGWMAKDAGRLLGGCSGCIYRTERFLEIDTNVRDGSKTTKRNIHVEHLVPVSMLKKHILSSALQDPEELLTLLLSSSICVAMTHNEERKLDLNFVPKSSSPTVTLDFLDEEKPFLRYSPIVDPKSNKQNDFQVYDMVRGQIVDIQSFTFSDHRSNIHDLFNG